MEFGDKILCYGMMAACSGFKAARSTQYQASIINVI